jgi:Cu/Ag efflux protein CusF
MRRLALPIVAVLTGLTVPGTVAGQQNSAARVTENTGRIERIDTSTRVITAVTPERSVHQVYVGPEIKEFETLKVGDQVTIRFTEAIIVRVKRDAQRKPVTDTTAQAQAKPAGAEGQVVQQLKAIVRIEEIDRATGVVKYRTADDMTSSHTVGDLKLLDGLKVGDTVEVEVTRARAISVARVSR